MSEACGAAMKLFLLHDPGGKDHETRTVIVRADSERRAREVAADQETSWKWRDATRTTCELLAPEGASGVVWFEP
jgi:hypothetical protein